MPTDRRLLTLSAVFGAVGLVLGLVPAALAQGGKKAGPLPPPAFATMIPLIDTHAHLDFTRFSDYAATLDVLIKTMDEFKVATTILMPTPMGGIVGQKTYDFPQLLPALQRHPGRVMLMAGPGAFGELYFQKAADAITDADRQVFRDKAEALAQMPIAGFGEIGIVHLSLPQMGNIHPYEAVPADHPLLLLLSDIAARNNLAIDIHFDLVPRDMDLPPMLANPNAYQPNPSRLVRNQDGLERFLAHNRQTKIVWAHVGGEPLATRTPAIVRDLLTRNPNLYMSFRIQRVRPEIPADALSRQGALKSDWVRLISDFPDRFVMGTDTFYQDSPEARGGDTVGLSNLQRLLMQLPPDVARKLAHDNVARIYRSVPAAQIPAPADLPTSNPIKGAGKKAKG